MSEPMKISQIKKVFDNWKYFKKDYLFHPANGLMYCIYDSRLIPVVSATFSTDAGSVTITLHSISELYAAIENLKSLMQSIKSFKIKDYEWLEVINDIDKIKLSLNARGSYAEGKEITIGIKSIAYVNGNSNMHMYPNPELIYILINGLG